MFHILVVEDDRDSRRLMETVLRREGYSVMTAENGRAALEVMDQAHVDLILLDVMMPEMDGYEFAATLREAEVMTPILMVTARQLPEDKKRGFLAGTDDYMTKPVDLEEMLLRVKALLRRSQIINRRKVTVGRLTLDYDTYTMRGEDGIEQELPPKEFQLLFLLLSYPGRIFTRLQLMDEIWGMDSESADNTVNVHIARLRRRLEEYPEIDLVSVRGVGYKAVVKA